jgi:hypothetical protein
LRARRKNRRSEWQRKSIYTIVRAMSSASLLLGRPPAPRRKLTALVGPRVEPVRDRSRALGRRLRAISRTVRRRTGERKAQVLSLTEQAGQLLARSWQRPAGWR